MTQSEIDPFDLSGEDWSPASGTFGGYERDCKAIVEASRSDPAYFPGIASFVFNSIQQPFWSIEDRLADTAREGITSRYLYGHKRTGMQYVLTHFRDLHAAAEWCASGRGGLDRLLMRYLEIPGLGIVKASFLAQLTAGQGACMDGINLHRFDLREDHFRHRATWTDKTRLAKVRSYNAYWQSLGDSAYWWDTWCEFQANRDVNLAGRIMRRIGTPDDVSRLHRSCLKYTVASG
jgi:hypothetical protein